MDAPALRIRAASSTSRPSPSDAPRVSKVSMRTLGFSSRTRFDADSDAAYAPLMPEDIPMYSTSSPFAARRVMAS